MKAFYLVALILAAAMVLSPFIFLRAEQTEVFEKKVASYGTYGAKIKSLDPATCGDTTSAWLQGEFYEGLYTYHYLKRPVVVVPQLAAGMPEVSDDKLTYTIRLKQGVKYHRNPCFGRRANGVPKTRTMTAADFVLAFKRVADDHIRTNLALAFIIDKIAGLKEYRARTKGYARGDFSRYDLPVAGVQAVDEHTLRFRLVKPFPQFLYVLAMNSYAPIPREVVDYHLAREDDGRRPIPLHERDAEIRRPEAAVGTGAYYLAEWVRANRIVLMRNEDFREAYYPTEGAPGDRAAGLLDDAGRRVPFIDARHYRFVAEEIPAWYLFLRKQVGVTGIPRDVFTQVITDDKQLTGDLAEEGIRLRTSTSPAVYWFAFNMADEVLGASKSLRQALQLAYDVEDHIEELLNGRGTRAKTYMPSTFEGHARAHSRYARYDLAAARQKLRQARRELVAGKVIGKDDPLPTLTLSMGQETFHRRMGEVAKRNFKRLGVELEIELNDWPTLQEKVRNKQAQIYSMGWHADYPDPENFLQLYYSPNIRRGTNNTNYANAAFDRLYEEASVMMPSAERTALYVKMLKMLNEDCPCLLLSEPVSFVLTHPWVANRKPHPIGYGYGKYARVDPALRKKAGGR
jgi:ABC-type transport system substrate-binding protein